MTYNKKPKVDENTSIDKLLYEKGAIKPVEIKTPDYSYGASQEPLNADYQVRNIRSGGSGGIGNNWAYSFVTSSGNTTNLTTTLPLNGGFNGGGVVLNDTANNGIKVNEDGLYYIQANGSFGMSSGTRIYTRIRINGNNIGLAQYYRVPSSTSIDYFPINISGIWYLNAGDIVTFVGYSDGTLDWVNQDISNWTIGGIHNEQGVMMQVYKL